MSSTKDNFVCTFCNKQFKSLGILKTHQKTAKFCLKLQNETNSVNTNLVNADKSVTESVTENVTKSVTERKDIIIQEDTSDSESENENVNNNKNNTEENENIYDDDDFDMSALDNFTDSDSEYTNYQDNDVVRRVSKNELIKELAIQVSKERQLKEVLRITISIKDLYIDQLLKTNKELKEKLSNQNE